MTKLTEWNELFYGPKESSARTKKRRGGLYYISEKFLGKHDGYSKLAFAVLKSAAIDKDRSFIDRCGESLCKYLGLDFKIVKRSVELIWEKNSGINK